MYGNMEIHKPRKNSKRTKNETSIYSKVNIVETNRKHKIVDFLISILGEIKVERY